MEKNPTSSFKIGGILGEKIFRKHLETSVIISLQEGDSRYVGKIFQKKKLSGQKSNFKLENPEYFG